MGPRRWGRGRQSRGGKAGSARLKLQWGHDAGVVEDPQFHESPGLLADASMGPRRWGRGRPRVHTRRHNNRRGPSFNGATTLGSWKTPPARSSGRPRGKASMGPRRWGRGRRPDYFEIAKSRIASMGPRRWGRGRRGLPTPRRLRNNSGFNGATTLGSWKTPTQRRDETMATKLQWGHDAGVVEDSERTRHGRCRRASMGPRRWGRGRPGARRAEGRGGVLQWGHDAGVVEDTNPINQLSKGRLLQWGHDAGVVEDHQPVQQALAPKCRFNGATTLGSWKTNLDVIQRN